MDDVADLVESWQGPDGALPRLTWYGPGAERVELSGRVLANWVIKCTNLLSEEADAEPGTRVHLHLPPHWRALVWALGTWLTGAQVTDAEGVDVVISDRPHQAPPAGMLIAVALPALAMAFDGDLPGGAIDGAADLMTYPDQLLLPTQPVALDEVAGPTWAGARRVLVTVGGPEQNLIAQVLGIWRAGASVVLVADPDADIAHVAAVEGAEPIKES